MATTTLENALAAVKDCIQHYSDERKANKATWSRKEKDEDGNEYYSIINMIEGLSVFVHARYLLPELSGSAPDEKLFAQDFKMLITEIESQGYLANPYLWSFQEDSFVDVASKFIVLVSRMSNISRLKGACSELTIEVDGSSSKLLDKINAECKKAVSFLSESSYEVDKERVFWAPTKHFTRFKERDSKTPVNHGHTYFSCQAIEALNHYVNIFQLDRTIDEKENAQILLEKGIRGITSLQDLDSAPRKISFYENLSKKSADIPSTVFAVDCLLNDSKDQDSKRRLVANSLNYILERIQPDLGGIDEFNKDISFGYLTDSLKKGKKLLPTTMDDRSTLGSLLKVLSLGVSKVGVTDAFDDYLQLLDNLAEELLKRRGRSKKYWNQLWYSSSAVDALCHYLINREETTIEVRPRQIISIFNEALNSSQVQDALVTKINELMDRDLKSQTEKLFKP